MEQIEQDFLALKQQNDKLKEKLKEAKGAAEDLAGLIATEIIFLTRPHPDISDELKKEAFENKRINAIAKYRNIDLEDSKSFAKYCEELADNFMKSDFKQRSGVDLGELCKDI